MQLPGRLARTTLGDLLGQIHRAGASGALELALAGPPARRHRIHVERGLVVGIEFDGQRPPHRLGEIAIRDGLLASSTIESVLWAHSHRAGEARRDPNGTRLGELLVARGLLAREVRDALLRKQVRLRLDAIYVALDGATSLDGEIRFHVGPGAIRRAEPTAPLLPREFLHGRRRARVTKRPHHTGQSPPRLTFDRLHAMRLLGVGVDADPATIRRAFRSAAARIHPDRHAQAPASERARLESELAALSAAYHLLCA
jgi:hypothetical protein